MPLFFSVQAIPFEKRFGWGMIFIESLSHRFERVGFLSEIFCCSDDSVIRFAACLPYWLDFFGPFL